MAEMGTPRRIGAISWLKTELAKIRYFRSRVIRRTRKLGPLTVDMPIYDVSTKGDLVSPSGHRNEGRNCGADTMICLYKPPLLSLFSTFTSVDDSQPNRMRSRQTYL